MVSATTIVDGDDWDVSLLSVFQVNVPDGIPVAESSVRFPSSSLDTVPINPVPPLNGEMFF